MSAHRLAEWLCQTGALRADAVSVEALTPLQMDRMRALQCASADAYLELVKANPEEQSRVVAACAPSETWLFRYAASFEFIRRLYQRTTQPIRALSAGSGGLAEPSSIAATLAAAGLPAESITVESIDQCVDAVRAPNVFAGMLAREPLPSWANAFFTPVSASTTGIALRSSLFSRIACARGDLRSCVLQSRYDIIFFRNVAIYLSDSVRTRVLTRLRDVLAPDGLLFVGHAEMRLAEQCGFAPVTEVGAFVLRARRERTVDAQPLRETTFNNVVRATEVRHLSAAAKPVPAREPLSPLMLAQDAVARDPSNASLHEALAEEELALGDSVSAEHSFRRALYLEQNRESALLKLGMLLEQQGRSLEADRLRARAFRAHLATEGGAR
jgi:chemotaxis protein methyltransferase WspC